MKTMMKFVLAVITVLLGGCSMSEKDKASKEIMSVINEYSNSLKKNGIRRSAYGLDYAGQNKIYDGKIHTIVLAYKTDKNMKYVEARTYFYTVVNGLLDTINENKDLTRHFFHFPIDYSDLEIHFSFEDDTQNSLKRDDVHSIHIVRNEIFYEIVNDEGPSEIQNDQVTPEIYITKGLLEKNRSIIRTVSEDLAMHSKSEH